MGQNLNRRAFHLNDGVNEIETFAIRQYIIPISRDIRDGNIVITIIIAILDPEPWQWLSSDCFPSPALHFPCFARNLHIVQRIAQPRTL